MKHFEAEVLFLNPDDVPHAQEALAAVGCKYTVDPAATADFPTVFGIVSGMSELAENDIGTWLMDIVWLLGGDVVEWRYGAPWKIRD